MDQPARSRALRVAGTGPMPMISGGTPAARGGHDSCPRLQPVPLDVRLAGDHHRRGTVVERAGVAGGDEPVGTVDRAELGEPLEAGVGSRPLVGGELTVPTGGRSRRRSVRSRSPSTARWCDRSANASSSVAGQAPALGDLLGGLRHRQGRVARRSAGWGTASRSRCRRSRPGLAHARAGFSVTHGARVIDSTPPATTRSASPAAISARAVATAVRPEAHNRLTVNPGTTVRQASEERRHPCDVAVVLAGLVGRAEDDLVDVGRVHPARATASRTTSAARSSGRSRPGHRRTGRSGCALRR